MDFEKLWRDYFSNWPADLPPRGVVVTAAEQVPFINFLASERILMLERMAPDTSGARRVLVPFGAIQAVKLTEVVKDKTLRNAGFTVGPPQKVKTV